MTYVTKDKRVIKIIKAASNREITGTEAREQIERLRPQEDAEFGYLDWEVNEALKDIKRKAK